jgi:hypothetical protein
MSNGGRRSPTYSYRETAKARRQLDDLAASNARFQNEWDGLVWLILRDPTNSRVAQLVIGKDRTYQIQTRDFLAIGMPVFLVVYSIIDPGKRILEIIEVVKI